MGRRERRRLRRQMESNEATLTQPNSSLSSIAPHHQYGNQSQPPTSAFAGDQGISQPPAPLTPIDYQPNLIGANNQGSYPPTSLPTTQQTYPINNQTSIINPSSSERKDGGQNPLNEPANRESAVYNGRPPAAEKNGRRQRRSCMDRLKALKGVYAVAIIWLVATAYIIEVTAHAKQLQLSVCRHELGLNQSECLEIIAFDPAAAVDNHTTTSPKNTQPTGNPEIPKNSILARFPIDPLQKIAAEHHQGEESGHNAAEKEIEEKYEKLEHHMTSKWTLYQILLTSVPALVSTLIHAHLLDWLPHRTKFYWTMPIAPIGVTLTGILLEIEYWTDWGPLTTLLLILPATIGGGLFSVVLTTHCYMAHLTAGEFKESLEKFLTLQAYLVLSKTFAGVFQFIPVEYLWARYIVVILLSVAGLIWHFVWDSPKLINSPPVQKVKAIKRKLNRSILLNINWRDWLEYGLLFIVALLIYISFVGWFGLIFWVERKLADFPLWNNIWEHGVTKPKLR